ncbi:hypothetical protein [Nostoc sp. DedQUE09]|uniref:hypothetical protein n=1 Tax=Nostoc sp. DedQUE09 TaxID=3075394 RepID=UPI002AD5633A|nr:hypothetical protein [Nostoc sp. DedQUE09]MDZ7950502.1 hypothetical protein [Nostoc sp. DedQUE09]
MPKDCKLSKEEQLVKRIDQLLKAKKDIEQEIQSIIASGQVAPSGCWIVRYLAKGRNHTYWYYKLQATNPIFLTKTDGKGSRYQHLGKAGSQAYLDALEQITRRAKIEALDRAVEILNQGLKDLVEETSKHNDEKMVEFKALAVTHRHVIKNYLHVSISEKHTPIAIAQKLLAKIDLKLDYIGRLGSRENRECVYRFVAPDDQRDSIFGQWLNRDEASYSELVSVTNNIVLSTPVIDTTSQILQEVVSSPQVQAWKGLKLKLQQGLDSISSSYSELISKVGEAVGVADGEPYWNAYLGQWQVWVSFTDGCRSVVCDWLVMV